MCAVGAGMREEGSSSMEGILNDYGDIGWICDWDCEGDVY